jgi:hypothetical protein
LWLLIAAGIDRNALFYLLLHNMSSNRRSAAAGFPIQDVVTLLISKRNKNSTHIEGMEARN